MCLPVVTKNVWLVIDFLLGVKELAWVSEYIDPPFCGDQNICLAI
jgi:hypothetical protein